MSINTVLSRLQALFMQNIFTIVLLLALFVAALYIIHKLKGTRYGALRYGRVVAADNSNWIKGETIRSYRYELSGKPDYIVKTPTGAYIPIEVKSSDWRGRVYEDQKWQALSYCLLLEEKYELAPPCAVIQYANGRLVELPYTEREKRDLVHLIEQIKSNPMPHYWAPERWKCARCNYAVKCDRRAA